MVNDIQNKFSSYFENFIPEYGESQHGLRHNNIRLPAISCEYEKMNAKYQMHYRLKELAKPSRPSLHPIVHIDGDTLSQSFTKFSKYLKYQFFHLIRFTVILMTATRVNIHDREVIFNIVYFGVFTRMFVHFHLYTTHGQFMIHCVT